MSRRRPFNACDLVKIVDRDGTFAVNLSTNQPAFCPPCHPAIFVEYLSDAFVHHRRVTILVDGILAWVFESDLALMTSKKGRKRPDRPDRTNRACATCPSA